MECRLALHFFHPLPQSEVSAVEKIETLEEFYQRKFNWIPESLKNDLGHFNLFSLKPYLEGKLKAVPYRRRDFYKIMLIKGSSTVHFADRVYEVKKQALSFSNPLVPYKWDHLDAESSGMYCIFNSHFSPILEISNNTRYFNPQVRMSLNLGKKKPIR